MIKIENAVLPSPAQWEAVIRGARNPMNSWDKMDSYSTHIVDEATLEVADFEYFIGENDLDLLSRLAKAGKDHRKFMRMITIYLDITAPLYWWKEFDTYKVGTVANSCSTMHKIQEKEFTMEDFSCEHLNRIGTFNLWEIIDCLNIARNLYLEGGEYKGEYYEAKDKQVWWQMI